MRSVALLFLIACLTGCGAFPRDPHGTLQRIQQERVFRVGVVAPAEETAGAGEAAELIKRVAARSGARPQMQVGEAEVLLHALEQGELDLVLGRFEKKTPWLALVTFSPPLRVEKKGKAVFQLAAAMRNGENGWIALVEREARNVAPEAQ